MAAQDTHDSRQDATGEQVGKSSPDDDRRQAGNASGDDSAEEESDRTPWYKRPKTLLVVAVVVAVLAVGIVLYWLHARKYVSTSDAFVDAHIVHVAPQVAGIVSEVAVKPNQAVKQGQLLVRIRTDQVKARLQQSEAAQAQAKAQLANARAGVAAAQSKYRQAEAQALAPEAQVTRAQQDLSRLEALQKKDPQAVAGTNLDHARAAFRQAKGQAMAARRAIKAAASQLDSARQQVGAAKAQLQVATAQVGESKINLGHYDLTASVPGHVAKMNVNVGTYVAPGTQIMALVPDKIWVTANFKETDIHKIHPGQPVDIKVDAFPGVHFKGVVASIQRGAGQAFQLLPPENASGNFVKVVQRVPVRILFKSPNPDKYPIGPGMSVTPTVKVR